MSDNERFSFEVDSFLSQEELFSQLTTTQNTGGKAGRKPHALTEWANNLLSNMEVRINNLTVAISLPRTTLSQIRQQFNMFDSGENPVSDAEIEQIIISRIRQAMSKNEKLFQKHRSNGAVNARNLFYVVDTWQRFSLNMKEQFPSDNERYFDYRNRLSNTPGANVSCGILVPLPDGDYLVQVGIRGDFPDADTLAAWRKANNR